MEVWIDVATKAIRRLFGIFGQQLQKCPSEQSFIDSVGLDAKADLFGIPTDHPFHGRNVVLGEFRPPLVSVRLKDQGVGVWRREAVVVEKLSTSGETNFVGPSDIGRSVLDQLIDPFPRECGLLQHDLENPLYTEPNRTRSYDRRPTLARMQRTHDFGATESLDEIVRNLPAKMESGALEAEVRRGWHGKHS